MTWALCIQDSTDVSYPTSPNCSEVKKNTKIKLIQVKYTTAPEVKTPLQVT